MLDKVKETIAKEYYKDKAFFDNDRQFAEKHFIEGFNEAEKRFAQRVEHLFQNGNLDPYAKKILVEGFLRRDGHWMDECKDPVDLGRAKAKEKR